MRRRTEEGLGLARAQEDVDAPPLVLLCAAPFGSGRRSSARLGLGAVRGPLDRRVNLRVQHLHQLDHARQVPGEVGAGRRDGSDMDRVDNNADAGTAGARAHPEGRLEGKTR